jgi:predicted ArsR family transcriptional regulator
LSTKVKILELLKRSPMSVVDLASELGVTRTAVNVPLRQLEAEGFVRSSQKREAGQLGKPPRVYEAAPGSEDRFSSAYSVGLGALLATLGSELAGEDVSRLLQATGKRLAREANLAPSADFDHDVRCAMKFADGLGAQTDVEVGGKDAVVRNYSCPLASSVRAEPRVCQIMAAYFGEATGADATEECQRGDRLICQYRLHR